MQRCIGSICRQFKQVLRCCYRLQSPYQPSFGTKDVSSHPVMLVIDVWHCAAMQMAVCALTGCSSCWQVSSCCRMMPSHLFNADWLNLFKRQVSLRAGVDMGCSARACIHTGAWLHCPPATSTTRLVQLMAAGETGPDDSRSHVFCYCKQA